MPQTLDLCVVHRMLACDSGTGKSGACDEVHTNIELPLSRIEVNTSNIPRSRDTEGGFKQLIRHSWLVLQGSFSHSAAITHDPSYWVGRASRVRYAGLTPALDPPNPHTLNSKEAFLFTAKIPESGGVRGFLKFLFKLRHPLI